MKTRWSVRVGFLVIVFLTSFFPPNLRGDDTFANSIRPFLVKNCFKCHQSGLPDQKEPKGDVDFTILKSEKDLLANAEMIGQIIDVLASGDMPPESEPEVADEVRKKLIGQLKQALKRTTEKRQSTRVRRLNRFQYNYTVKDLFRLDRDVFALSEKLMTRHSDYLKRNLKQMPDEVRAESHALSPRPGLRNVKAFPKDLRAAHGFDNQSNQLTMSPLLLDAFLRLAVSIVESPDFNDKTVGIWKELFAEPTDPSLRKEEIKNRLTRFLTRAFRSQPDSQVVDRYTDFVLAKIETGMTFTDSMKKAVSAALSSPLFLFRVETGEAELKQNELASRLSYLLWSSAPDDELLKLAHEQKLLQPDVLQATIDRMFVDPKIERFLDTFPAQWLQLENVLAATPDPAKQRYFSLDKNHPASLQMLIEPLLLVDAAFVENRPISDLIQPEFGYQSRFLQTWYTSSLKPPKVDVKKINEENRAKDQLRKLLGEEIKNAESTRASLTDPIRKKLLQQKSTDNEIKHVDLKPLASWEFDGDLKASKGGLDLQPHGKIEFKNGMVRLNKSYLLSQPIPVDLNAKTLEVWCTVPNLDMRGGGVMGIQGEGDFFDTIVIGERKPRHWISGSNGFSRTLDFPESTPEDQTDQLLHLVMVYKADGSTLLYRNGQPYGKPFKRGRAVFPKNRSRVIFGLRHLPAGGNRFLNVSIDRALLYDRALNPEEVAAANSGKHLYVTDKEMVAAMSDEQKEKKLELDQLITAKSEQLKKVTPNQDPKKAVQDARNRYDNEIRQQLRDQVFRRIKNEDPRYGGVITNAAIMSMTSGPKRSHPIARGAWIIEVIFNDPPPPPPNDVPPLNEDSGDQNLTIREKFKVHRENPDCAGCHSRLDPLGFAMENFDLTGRWRDRYSNGRDVDMKGKLMRRHEFENVVDFKKAILNENDRIAKAFTKHLLRFALGRELSALDQLEVEQIAERSRAEKFAFRKILKEVILSETFLNSK